MNMVYKNIKDQIVELEEKLARFDDEAVLKKTSLKAEIEKLRAIESTDNQTEGRKLLLG